MRSLLDAVAFAYRPLEAPPAPGAGHGWIVWITPLGLATGGLASVLLAYAWRYLHNLELTVALLLAAWALGPAAGRILAWARLWPRLRGGVPTDDRQGVWAMMVLAVALALLVWFTGIAALPHDPWTTTGRLPRWLARILQPQKMWAGVTLAFTWGNASMLLGSLLGPADGRVGQDGDGSRPIDRLLKAPGWLKMLCGWCVPTAVTVLFFARWWSGGWASAMAMSVIQLGAMLMLGWLLARRRIAHDRTTLLAGALLGELLALVQFKILVG